MKHASPVFDESEVVTATSGLVMGSINPETRIMTEQKGTDCAVANEEHVAGSISS
jgi:hypothetical protein